MDDFWGGVGGRVGDGGPGWTCWGLGGRPFIGLPVGTVPDQVPNLLTPEINNSISLNVVSLI